MTVAEKVREKVRGSYGAAVRAERSCCADAVPKGVAAQTAGYTRDELAALPQAAVVNSFGCGNPLAFSEVKPGQTVLDLGSGAGIDLLLAAGRVGPTGRVIGVDMTDEMIARARESAAKAGLAQVETRKGLIEELPVESGTVDWVISNCVINLSPEKDRVFAEIARVLRPGGRISISDIVVEDMPWWVRRSARLHCACVAGAISEADYVAGLERAGLVDVEVTERLVYERSQIVSLARSEVATTSLPRWLRSAAGRLAGRLAAGFAGRVWSAKFVGAAPR
ncbi:MAG: arsenite methyltransferase [Acidobacteriota bacterium]|nr:arsenite methyltransferase [Acidobacteriota bacterium]MDH3525246.1 arsenite methyltransferase [Acidobacteriota bacterium]